MNTAKIFVTTVFTILVLLSTARVQAQALSNSTPVNTSVTASAAADRVRFTAPSNVVQMRLEVYGANGTKLFDNEIRGGNVIDWHLVDGQAAPFADGAYLCVITVKNLSGKITQKIGSLKIEQRIAKMQATELSQLTAQQTSAIGPVEEDALLTILETDHNQTATVVAHDGTDGQIIRGRGALSFRLGDFYSGKDSEQMRLTAEGNFGIGVVSPQAKLDVAGTIRTGGGIVFPDGSIQYSAASKTLGARSSRARRTTPDGQEVEPNVAGTGTQNRIARWTDNVGTLGDANIYEVSGSIGINAPPDPIFKLDVLGYNRFRAPNVSFYLSGFKAGGNDWVFQTVDDNGRFRIWGGTSTTGAERLAIMLDTGNVGIGTGTPATKLDVAGAINSATQYNLGGSRILSNAGTGNLFAGVNAGAVNTAGGNSFFGNNAGFSNTTGDTNSFFGNLAGVSNTTGSRNTFVGYRAGLDNTTGNDSAFFGYQAGQNTTTSKNAFFGSQAGAANTTGQFNAFFGYNAGTNNTGSYNTFFGGSAGSGSTTGNDNAFFGNGAGINNTTGLGNTLIGSLADVGSGNLSFATAIGASALVSASNTIALGRSDGSDKVVIYGLGTAGSTHVCRNAANQLSTCSSSLRYKTGVQPYLGGLGMIHRLQPITFKWKDDGRRDLGFAAEAVERVDPILVTYNDKGEVEGVKYGQLTAVLVNAIKQQQTQIRTQEEQLTDQQQQNQTQQAELRHLQHQLDALKKLFCRSHPKAKACK